MGSTCSSTAFPSTPKEVSIKFADAIHNISKITYYEPYRYEVHRICFGKVKIYSENAFNVLILETHHLMQAIDNRMVSCPQVNAYQDLCKCVMLICKKTRTNMRTLKILKKYTHELETFLACVEILNGHAIIDDVRLDI